MMERTQAVLAQLKRAGLKLTPQRKAIVHELAGDGSHPTAQELFERLRPNFPAMSFATVYNTLDALAKNGLIRTIRLGTAVRFDPNTAAHHHAVCDGCGVVVDVPLPAPAEPARAMPNGFSVRSEERTYRGSCSRCS
jgi:Fur family peroxide stress response transcriptional regulator